MNDEQTKGTLSDVKGKFEEAAGKATGNEEQELHGKAKQVQGEAQKGLGDVQDDTRDTLGDVQDTLQDVQDDTQDTLQDVQDDAQDAVDRLGR